MSCNDQTAVTEMTTGRLLDSITKLCPSVSSAGHLLGLFGPCVHRSLLWERLLISAICPFNAVFEGGWFKSESLTIKGLLFVEVGPLALSNTGFCRISFFMLCKTIDGYYRSWSLSHPSSLSAFRARYLWWAHKHDHCSRFSLALLEACWGTRCSVNQ